MKLIKNFIAKLLMLFALSFAFSCNNPSPDITGAATEWTGNWEMGQKVNIDYVYVQPTWGQSFYFAFKDGYAVAFVIAILLFIAGIYSLYKVAANKTKTRAGNIISIIVGAVGIIGSLAFTFTRPGTIKWNNNIKIEKSVYEKYKADDNLKGMWDDLYSGKFETKIVGTSGE